MKVARPGCFTPEATLGTHWIKSFGGPHSWCGRFRKKKKKENLLPLPGIESIHRAVPVPTELSIHIPYSVFDHAEQWNPPATALFHRLSAWIDEGARRLISQNARNDIAERR
jgi:hypothetical protein